MTANQLPIIALDDVSKQYQTGVDALKHVTLQIENGEFVFIVGKSGSGKSTFIKLLLKELDPTSGKLYIAGRLVNKLKRKQVPLYRRNIGVVFQDFRLLKDRTVFENIAFAQPTILLADEPTGNLDPQNAWEIMMLLQEVNKMGTTVVVVTHNNDIVDVMQKRVVTLSEGTVVRDDKKGGYEYERD